MNPMQKAQWDYKQIAEIQALLRKQYPEAIVRQMMKDAFEGDTFLNDVYQVTRREMDVPGIGKMWHLSIKRIDREVIKDWRDFQAIKNQLCGPECEGAELYPAERRLVDTANQYHIFVIQDPRKVFPFGFFERMVSGEDLLPELPRVQQRERVSNEQ